jgi:hypothetical protein
MYLTVAQAATLITRYSTALFGDNFGITKENTALISTISVLPSGNGAFYHIYNAQQFLQPHILS